MKEIKPLIVEVNNPRYENATIEQVAQALLRPLVKDSKSPQPPTPVEGSSDSGTGKTQKSL